MPIALAKSFTRQASGRDCSRALIRFRGLNLTAQLLGVVMLLAGLQRAVAAPTIVSTIPSNGATGVSPAASVVFTFSTAMNPAATSAIFSDAAAGFESPEVLSAWSAGNTVLTCTPSPQFANNHTITWSVGGEDAVGNFLTGTTSGSFTTIMGVNGGSGTNAFTTFLLIKYTLYQQTSGAPPPLASHEFVTSATLASNRTATGVTVTIPVTSGISNLVQDPLQPENFNENDFVANVTNFDTTFPSGNYVFNVSGTPNQQVTVNLPNYVPPNAPVISNYTAAHAIDPSQPFTLNWNTFTNGTVADGILFQINGSGGTILFQTLGFGASGSINGTAKSAVIPAGILPANSTNNATLIFAHLTAATNSGTVTLAIVASATLFTVSTVTSSSTTPAPVLAIIHSGTNVLVEWPTNATGYNLEFSTNLSSSGWSSALPAPVVINTNEVVTNGISGTRRFFRLSNP